MRDFCLLFLALGVAGPSQAQTAPDEPDREIVVLGRGLDVTPGTPAYGSIVIDRDRLTGDASGRIENILLDVAGFQQFRRSDSRSSNPSAQGVTLRALGGNASSRALVLLDGVPQADPFFGYIPFNALVPDRLASIRITRGGGAGAFGAGAVAGTIELSSATRADLPLVAGSAFAGSRSSYSGSAALSPTLGRGYLTAAGQWEEGAGFFTTPAALRGPNDVRARYRDWSGNLRAVAPLGESAEIQGRLLIFRDDRTLRFRGADSTSEGQDASLRVVRHGDWGLDALAYVQLRNFTNRVISATSFRLTLDQRDTPSTGVGGKIELRPPVADGLVLRLGLDARLAEGMLYEDAYGATTGLVTARRNAGGRSSTIGTFVESDWTVGPLVLTGGVRGDRWTITDGFFRERSAANVPTSNRDFGDRDGIAATGRLGAALDAGEGVKLRAAGYTGFRLPTLNELYRPFVVFPITTQANEALGLERLKGVEVGAEIGHREAALAVTAFYNRLDDAIANVTVGSNLRQRRNVDAIVARGIEVSGRGSVGAVSLSFSYAFSDSRVHASGMSAALDGFAPAQSPRHAASATLAWTPQAGPSLAGTVRHVGRQFEDDLESDVLPAATTIDAVAAVPIGSRLEVVGRAENLLDETVVTRNSGGSIDLGTPRTLWIGLRLK